MDPDWVSHSREYAREMGATMIEIGKTGPFWLPEKKIIRPKRRFLCTS